MTMMHAAIAFNEGRRSRQDALDLYTEMQRLRKTDPRRMGLFMQLSTQHPVIGMPFDDFLMCLRMAVQSNLMVSGRHKTKTYIEMSRGLEHLNGTSTTPMPNATPFDWEASIELLGPFVGALYVRMHAELQLRNKAPSPALDQ